MTRAIVVGAGAAGLVAAWELARAGWSVTVLEAGPRPGGLLAGVEVAGLTLDAGAEGYSVRGGGVADLLADLGAAGRIVAPNSAGAWLQTAAGARPIPKRLVFGMPADPDADDVRAVVGEVPPAGPVDAGASLAAVVRAGYGDRVLDDLVVPLVGGVYSTDADRVTLADLAPALAARVAAGEPLRAAVAATAAATPEGGAVHGLTGGMHTLAGLLLTAAEAAPGNVELACDEPVDAIDARDDGWRVTTNRRRLVAPALVLAVGLDVAARLLGAPAVPSSTAIEVITVVLDSPGLAGDEPRGTGVLVAAGVPRVAAKALTHSTAKWPWLRESTGGADVVRLSYGRRGQPPATHDLSGRGLAERVGSDVAALLGRPVPPPAALARTRWRILTPGTPHAGAVREWLTGRRAAGLTLVGAGVAGVGLAAVVPHARAEVARLMRSFDG